jgi:hypothetical protein
MPRPKFSRSLTPWLAALAGLALPVLPTALLLSQPACDGGGESPAVEPPVTAPVASTASAAPPIAEAEQEPVQVEPPVEPPVTAPAGEADVPRPTGVRVSSRTIIVYAAPRYGSDMRGRIDRDAPFAIYGLVEGSGCAGEGWARAGHRDGDGFVCLKAATPTDAAPQVQPVVPEGLVVPFLYAKPKADRKGKLLAEVPRYKSRFALTGGREPDDWLEPNRQYAFVDLRPLPGHGNVYEDADEQIVPAKDMRAEQPSEFSGRVLADAPVGEGRVAAWAISREAVLRGEPRMKSPVVGLLEFHQAIEVVPGTHRGGGNTWLTIPDGLGPGVPAYVEASKVRWYDAGPKLDGVAADETWIDVDLQQQILAVMQGDQPVFITLISSGTGSKPGTATPRGTYRIRNKLALGAMRNRPEDLETSPYHVEGVPWVQYFYRRFALHGAYWHNGFGHRKSHGCVNLAPKDARYVYGLTTPEVPPGWTSSYEHAGELGSVVRLRKGQELGEDRRTINDVEPDAAPEQVLADGTP